MAVVDRKGQPQRGIPSRWKSIGGVSRLISRTIGSQYPTAQYPVYPRPAANRSQGRARQPNPNRVSILITALIAIHDRRETQRLLSCRCSSTKIPIRRDTLSMGSFMAIRSIQTRPSTSWFREFRIFITISRTIPRGYVYGGTISRSSFRSCTVSFFPSRFYPCPKVAVLRTRPENSEPDRNPKHRVKSRGKERTGEKKLMDRRRRDLRAWTASAERKVVGGN